MCALNTGTAFQENCPGTIINEKISLMKTLFCFILAISVFSCKDKGPIINSIEMIESEHLKKIYFDGLMSVTNNSIESTLRQDSLAFLILPLEASCPSCRKKTIDSIIHRQYNLKVKHFIILSSATDYKTINGYFVDRKGALPKLENQLFLDTTNNAGFLQLFDKKPTFYYSYQGKVYKKVAAIPATVKEDLREFFSGYRKKSHNSKS